MIITGSFQSIADFDPDTGTYYLTSSGAIDIFIQKLNIDGNLLWAKRMGSQAIDYSSSITTDLNDNIYTTGYFLGTVDFDPGSGTHNLIAGNNSDMFIQKLDSNGNFNWALSVGDNNSENGYSVSVDTDNSVYTTGSFQGTVDFDPDSARSNSLISANSLSDIFILKLSQCSRTSGTDSITSCDSYTWTDGITYTASNYSAKDTLINSQGCDSIVSLILTINNTNNTIDSITACKKYTWINGITYRANNNTAVDTLVNAIGCDSIVTLNLTILNLDTSTYLSRDTFIANIDNARYQWLDCNNNFAEIPDETFKKFLPNKGGSYAVEIIDNNCIDTSSCKVSTVGLIENSFSDNFMIYPNPTNGAFSIKFENTQKLLSVRLLSIAGQVIIDKTFHNANLVDMEINAVNGVYLLEIKNEKNQKAVYNLLKK